MSVDGSVVLTAPAALRDDQLVADARAGVDGAFEELYRRHHGGLHAFVRRYVRDDGRAEDVTQEAFVSALRGLRAHDRAIAFKPWLYEIARNAAIDSHRRTSRAQEVSIDEPLAPADQRRLVGLSAPETEVIARERMDHLYGALGELCERHERIIVLRELEGLSYREIAERMGITQAAVETALFRARRRLELNYAEIEEGGRCAEMHTIAARVAEEASTRRERQRLGRHVRHCGSCRAHAVALGISSGGKLLRLDRGREQHGTVVSGGGEAAALLLPAKAVALIAAAALVGGGGATIAGLGPLAPHGSGDQPAPARLAPAPPKLPRQLVPATPRGERPAAPREATPRGDAFGRGRVVPPPAAGSTRPPAASPPIELPTRRATPPADFPAPALPWDGPTRYVPRLPALPLGRPSLPSAQSLGTAAQGQLDRVLPGASGRTAPLPLP